MSSQTRLGIYGFLIIRRRWIGSLIIKMVLKWAIALDPGVRTFQTGFSNDSSFLEYGTLKGSISLSD